MKKLLFLLFFFVLSMTGYSQEIYSYDFSDAVGVVTYNVDKNTPSEEMKLVGFTLTQPWLCRRESNASKNFFGVCSSSYTPAGQANKWLVNKEPIEIPSVGCVLEWKSQAYDTRKRDGLKIFISTIGRKLQDFSTTPAWEIEEEEAGSDDPDVIESEWVEHSIPLDVYAGQAIYIAFVNQSYDKSMILLDDIWVGRRTGYAFSLTGDEYVTATESKVSGLFRVIGDVTIDSYTVYCAYGDTEYSKSYSGLGLANGDTHAFVFDEGIPLETGSPVEYRVWVEVNGKTSFEQKRSVVRIPYFPKRNVVVEEGTGTWCGNCVLGLWAMDYMRETYDEEGFIGIGVHNGDAMTDEDYNASLGFSALPMGLMNRKFVCTPTTRDFQLQTTTGEPKTFVDHYLKAREMGTIGEITVEGSYNSDSTQIQAKAVVKSVATIKNVDYRVAFVLIENGVKGYKQSNYFSGFSQPVGGFEDLPSECNITFNEVARGIWPTFKGQENSLPQTLTANTPVEYSYTITIPDKVRNVEHLELIGLLLDGKSGEIMNATKSPMTSTAHGGISQVKEDLLQTSVSNGQLSVLMEGKGTVRAELFDMSGRKIGAGTGDSNVTFRIPSHGYRGVAVLRVCNDKDAVTRKVYF